MTARQLMWLSAAMAIGLAVVAYIWLEGTSEWITYAVAACWAVFAIIQRKAASDEGQP